MKKATIFTTVLALALGMSTVFGADAYAKHHKKKHHKAKPGKVTTTTTSSNHTTTHHTPGVPKHSGGTTTK